MFKKVIIINKFRKRQTESQTLQPEEEQIDVSFLVQPDPLLKDLDQRPAPERKPEPELPNNEESGDTLQYLDQLFDQALKLEEEKMQAQAEARDSEAQDDAAATEEAVVSDTAAAEQESPAAAEEAQSQRNPEESVQEGAQAEQAPAEEQAQEEQAGNPEQSVQESAQAEQAPEAAKDITEEKAKKPAAKKAAAKNTDGAEKKPAAKKAPAKAAAKPADKATEKSGEAKKPAAKKAPAKAAAKPADKATEKSGEAKKPAAKKAPAKAAAKPAEKSDDEIVTSAPSKKAPAKKPAAKKKQEEVPEELLVAPMESDPEEERFRGEDVMDIDYGDDDDEDEEKPAAPESKPEPKAKKAPAAKTKEATEESIAEAASKKPAAKKSGKDQDISFGTSATGKATIDVPKVPRTPPAPKKKAATESGSGLKFLFQPVIEPTKGGLWGFECLLRIFDVELGELKPSIFLDVAQKDLRLIKRLELWSMEEVFLTSKRMADKDLGMLSVNISTKHFLDPTFIPNTLKIISNVGAKQDNVYFEFKQELLTNFDTADVFEKLQTLRDAGVKTCIDDFNADYFKGNMKEIPPIDMLKFDRALTRTFLTSPESKSAIRTIIAFAKANKMEVVGVGVETKEHEEGLIKLGIKKMQGYFYSKPMRSQRMVIKKK